MAERGEDRKNCERIKKRKERSKIGAKEMGRKEEDRREEELRKRGEKRKRKEKSKRGNDKWKVG